MQDSLQGQSAHGDYGGFGGYLSGKSLWSSPSPAQCSASPAPVHRACDSHTTDSTEQLLVKLMTELQVLREQNNVIQERLRVADNERAQLRRCLSGLESKMGHGQHTPSCTRCSDVLQQVRAMESRLVPLEVGMKCVDDAEQHTLPASFWPSGDFADDHCARSYRPPKPQHQQRQHHHHHNHNHNQAPNSGKSKRRNSNGCGGPPGGPQPDLTDRQLVALGVHILRENGPLPIGKLGSMLHRAANNHKLPTILKERFGGLKKFLAAHKEFSIGVDHPYNPTVSTAHDASVVVPALTAPHCGSGGSFGRQTKSNTTTTTNINNNSKSVPMYMLSQ